MIPPFRLAVKTDFQGLVIKCLQRLTKQAVFSTALFSEFFKPEHLQSDLVDFIQQFRRGRVFRLQFYVSWRSTKEFFVERCTSFSPIKRGVIISSHSLSVRVLKVIVRKYLKQAANGQSRRYI